MIYIIFWQGKKKLLLHYLLLHYKPHHFNTLGVNGHSCSHFLDQEVLTKNILLHNPFSSFYHTRLIYIRYLYITDLRMSDSPPINLVTQLNLHCFQLRMMSIWFLLKVRVLLSFYWISRLCLTLLTMIQSLILSAPGLVPVGWFWIGSSLTSETVSNALRLGQFYPIPKSYCMMYCIVYLYSAQYLQDSKRHLTNPCQFNPMVCLKALSLGQSFFHSKLHP